MWNANVENPTSVYATVHVSNRIVDVRNSDGTACCWKQNMMFDDKLNWLKYNAVYTFSGNIHYHKTYIKIICNFDPHHMNMSLYVSL